VRLRRRSPTKGLEFELAIPEGLNVYRDVAGTDLIVVAGELEDVTATAITVGAVRDGGPVTREEHVRRVRENLTRELDPHLVDEAPVPLAGHESWWTIDAVVVGGRSLVLDSWMLVRDGVGWTASVRMPWAGMHQLRDSAIAIVSTLRFT
jgi:hypothetical protein